MGASAILDEPLVWFLHLLHATPAQRENCEPSRRGLHWDELNEDISVTGLLAGTGDQTRRPPEAARGQSACGQAFA